MSNRYFCMSEPNRSGKLSHLPNRFPISRSRNRSVLSVLEYRQNGSTEPIGNPERVGPNRPKHAIYRPGSNRESVLDQPNASSALYMATNCFPVPTVTM